VKKIFALLSFAAALQVSGALISKDVAVTKSLEWMSGNPVMGAAGRTVDSVEVFPETGYQVFVVRLLPSGYLILNADDQLPLVVSFSAVSSVDLSADPQNAFRSMLLRHVARMEELLRQPSVLAMAIHPVDPLAVTELHGPFMETTWNQCNPYNKLCPDNPAGTEYYAYRAASGCVPTAYAQVMNFHRWPLCGSGSRSYTDSSGDLQGTHSAIFSDTYDWGSMQPAYDAYNGNPEAAESAVSELMYELGVAVGADYEPGWTSASTSGLGTRLSEHFYFEPCEWHSSLSSLTAPLEADLRAGFPCVVAIPGHAIVADGLMVDSGVTTYHINYGWGGANNGWWSADNVAGDVLEDGVTSLRPQLLAFPLSNSVARVAGESVEVQWVLPRQREIEAEALTIYRLEEQEELWQSDASELNASINSGWEVVSGGRSGDCWYAGPNGPAAVVLDEVFVPDGATSLTFWSSYRLGTATFTVSASTNGGLSYVELSPYNNHYSLAWQEMSLSLASFAGTQIRLRFALSSGSYYPDGGGVWIDDLSLNSGTWLNWVPFYVDNTLASHRFSAVTSELDNCDDFTVFGVTSSSTFKDWVCSTTGGVDNCFYKQPGGYSNHEYHLTSVSSIIPTSATRLLLRARYRLGSDGFRVLVSTDNINFTEIWSAAGTIDWGNISIDLGAYAGQSVYLRLEYIPGSYYSNGGVWVDTVSTQVVTNPELEGQPVHYTPLTDLPAGIHTLAAAITDTSDVEHSLAPSFTLAVYDNDGMPLSWEEQYGLNPFADDSALDPDLDGFSNLDEYIAGTHPGDSNSVFRIGIEGHMIKWPALNGRTYRILKADGPGGPFDVLQSVDGPVSNYTDGASVPCRFYRVDVDL